MKLLTSLKKNYETTLLEQLAGGVEPKKKYIKSCMKFGNFPLTGKIVEVMNLYGRNWIRCTTTHARVNGSLQLMPLNTFIALQDFL